MQLTEHQIGLVRTLLTAHVPGEMHVYVFGSRALRRARRASDLDLLLDGHGPIDGELIIDLKEAFDESDLPWKVDVVDRATITPAFARAIEADLIAFPTT